MRYFFILSLLMIGNIKAFQIETTGSAVIATIDPKKDRITLHWLNRENQPYKSFEALKKEIQNTGKRLLFATNSGIYAVGFKPLGLHIENGKTLIPINRARKGNDNFSMLPNGIFWTRKDEAGIIESRSFMQRPFAVEHATQSGPLVLYKGKIHPDFRAKSTSFKIRSGVGICSQKIKFIITQEPVNFYQFAQLWKKQGCSDALYLDGSISAYATENQNTQWIPFAGIWSVTNR